MTPLDAAELLNREFLEIRARLLQVAASLDRISRAQGTVASDPRLEKIGRALAVLQSSDPDRAEQIQLIFSRPYLENWPQDFGLRAGSIAAKNAMANNASARGGANGSPGK
jgi:hypothetical protein